MTNPFHKAVVELKVIASTAATAVVGVVVGILNAVVADPEGLLGDAVPGWAQFVILAVIPPVVTYVSGWKAPHTERPDLVHRPNHKL